jgi:hypothetical protein
MATLNLLPRNEFVITLDSGTVIRGKFGTWATYQLSKKLACKPEQLGDKATENYIEFSLNFILAAVEFAHMRDKAPFSYTLLHVTDWIDELGGISSPEFIALCNHASSTDEKKTEEKQIAEAPAGEISSDTSTQPGEA